MCLVYGLDKGPFWIIPEGLFSIEKVVLECVSAVNYFLLVISVFSFNFL